MKTDKNDFGNCQPDSGSAAPPCSVLFLDVDGVLNRCGKSHTRLEPDLLENLAWIVDETDCKIVVSSTWRRYECHLAELRLALDDIGLTIHGCTPTEGYKCRGDEIAVWMVVNGMPLRFCIVDDDGDMGALMPYLVQTHCFEGLTRAHARRIVDTLNSVIE